MADEYIRPRPVPYIGNVNGVFTRIAPVGDGRYSVDIRAEGVPPRAIVNCLTEALVSIATHMAAAMGATRRASTAAHASVEATGGKTAGGVGALTAAAQ